MSIAESSLAHYQLSIQQWNLHTINSTTVQSTHYQFINSTIYTLNLHTINSSTAVFELRKNKWLSHGQPGYNFRLSVQVFGCPYLEHIPFILYKSNFWWQINGCPSDNWISIFGCPATFLVVPGARTTEISNADQQYNLHTINSSTVQSTHYEFINSTIYTLSIQQKYNLHTINSTTVQSTHYQFSSSTIENCIAAH